MEYVQGVPLDAYCREAHLSLEERLHLFNSICDAVNYAHSRAVVHLDLKPSNILVKADGTPKLLDFGIARHLQNADEPANLTQTQIRFTPAFAAPEQFLRELQDFFVNYHNLEGKPYSLLGCKGTGTALRLIKQAQKKA